ncbi:uncharacterized protein LOC109721996 isoform X2 [Ananas comosus]|uniref:Uncharacterized protein LOC109721996 isoform X2 n=1 Tax=Ananas comosus TaxID=4615 RepID=A0A6P5GB98_ANACO|nr:uncharacterized protein LOC109721996 isoform X2 [Ananas comosus]
MRSAAINLRLEFLLFLLLSLPFDLPPYGITRCRFLSHCGESESTRIKEATMGCERGLYLLEWICQQHHTPPSLAGTLLLPPNSDDPPPCEITGFFYRSCHYKLLLQPPPSLTLKFLMKLSNEMEAITLKNDIAVHGIRILSVD